MKPRKFHEVTSESAQPKIQQFVIDANDLAVQTGMPVDIQIPTAYVVKKVFEIVTDKRFVLKSVEGQQYFVRVA